MFNSTVAAKVSLASSTMSAMIIGFLGNSVIIFLFIFNKGLRNGTNYHLVNIAICYMSTSVLHMPACLISISSGPSPFSPFFCQLLQFTNDLIHTQICLATCALCFYHCCSIHRFSAEPRASRDSRAKLIPCCATWVLSTTASVVAQSFNEECSDVFSRYSNFIISWTVFIGLFVVCAFISLACLVMTYSLISRTRISLFQRIKQDDSARAHQSLSRFSQSVTTSLLIFVLSFFCSTPIAVYRVFAGRHILQNRYFYTLCLVQVFFMQAAIFPVLIAYRSRTFRMGFRQLFCAVISHPVNNDSLLQDLQDSSPILGGSGQGNNAQSGREKENRNRWDREDSLSCGGSKVNSMGKKDQLQQNGHCVTFEQVNAKSNKGHARNEARKMGATNEPDAIQSDTNVDFSDDGVSSLGEKVFVEITDNEVKIHHHQSRTNTRDTNSSGSITRNSNNCSVEMESLRETSISPADTWTNQRRCSPFDDSISRTLSEIDARETYI